MNEISATEAIEWVHGGEWYWHDMPRKSRNINGYAKTKQGALRSAKKSGGFKIVVAYEAVNKFGEHLGWGAIGQYA